MDTMSMPESHDGDVVRMFVAALREVSGKQFDGVNAESVIADLGVDSLSLMQVVGILEDQLDVTLADEQISRIRTVGDVERLIAAERKLPG
jgi:acyl carrier protein